MITKNARPPLVTTTLDEQTAVTPDDDGFVADVCPDWQTFGPLGGYLAAVGLRAASLASAQPLPGNASVQFIGRPTAAEPLMLRPQVLRKSSAAECVRITATQQDAVAFEATFWFLADAGKAAPYTQRRDTGADPRSLPCLQEVIDKRPLPWDSAVERFPVIPAEWTDMDAAQRPLLDPPIGEEWYRFPNKPEYDDPTLEAMRLLIVADCAPWIAMNWSRVPISREYFPTTITLTTQFHSTSGLGEYLLVKGEGAGIRHDAYTGIATIWAEDGRLLASGTQDNLMRQPFKR